MLKEIIKSIFLWGTNPLVLKNVVIKENKLKVSKKKLIDKYFPNDQLEIQFKTKSEIQINLQRQSRLTEYILLENFEEAELAFIRSFLNNGDIVFEIGANIGLHALEEACVVGTLGKVYAFEPSPQTFELLKRNILLNNFSNISAHNIGLSNKKSKMNLNVSKNYDAWNTLVDKIKLLNNSEIFEETVEVDLNTLDDFINENNIEKSKIKLIKIDVEGWEKFVIEGGHDFLVEYTPLLMVEFDENNTWAAGYTGQHLYDQIISYGYSIYRLENGKLISEPKRLHYPSQNLFALKNSN
jgi:FkbM family methyltransferase